MRHPVTVAPARRSRSPLAAVLMVAPLVAGCSGAGSGPGAPPSTAAAIATADALFHSSRYTAAERAYTELVAEHPADSAAHAALALFLNYEQAPERARNEAERAVMLEPRDGHSRAILCRVHDWANRLEEALQACRVAVTEAPRDPLARLFLSEVLADHGDAAAAREEIARGRALAASSGDPYVRAEVPREEANLAHDIGDMAGRISSLVAARTVQPQFMNRSVELAGAYQDADNPAAAADTVAAAAATAPADGRALQELGSSAILSVDYPGARSVWARLLSMSPRDPHILEVAGQIAIAADHDIDGGERRLEAALALDPRDPVAAGYLLALARFVRGDESRGRAEISAATGRGVPVDPDRATADHARAALAEVNVARGRAGLPAVALDARLSQSALAHSYYWLVNNASPAVAKLGIHRETPGALGFRGATPAARAQSAGYPDARVGEDITHLTDPKGAVDDWVDSVYHRFPILRPDLQVIGYGDASVGPLPIDDMEFGFGNPGTQPPVAYPADGQTSVPTTFSDHELPDPLPAAGPRVSGYPVTVTFRPAAAVRLVSLTLSAPAGAPLDAEVLPPGPDTENSASLLTRVPLQPATRYTARVVAIVDGGRYDRTWSFSTS